MHQRALIGWLAVLVVVLSGGCGAPKDPCEDVPCSAGRVCVVRSVGKVACEVPDGGAP